MIPYRQSYVLDLSSLVGGRQAGDLHIVDAQTALIDVWHPELVSPLASDRSNWSEVAFENGHLWWRWQIGSSQAEPIHDQPPGAFGGVIYPAGERRLVMQAESDFSASTLFELDAGGLAPRISGPGYVWGVARVR